MNINSVESMGRDISEVTSTENTSQESISSKLIRFHVIANSDSVEDQALKLKVRDAILEYIYPKLKGSNSLNESRKIIKDNEEELKKIAIKVIKEKGYNYTVNTSLSYENFPAKSYGIITLPQGKYEAFRIIIGSGKGQNWWCVMFPPLCFIDVTKGEVSNKETEKEMKKVLNNKEYNLINNTVDINNKDDKSNTQIIVKFKIVEVIKDIKDKIFKK
jgi:stage II sporulation protein R